MAMQTDHQSTGTRRNGKSASAFRTISEVADDLDVPPHVLRFWETKFSQVRPLKRGVDAGIIDRKTLRFCVVSAPCCIKTAIPSRGSRNS